MKTRILTIAPYQGLKEMINEAISDRDDLEMTVRIGDLANGLEIVRSYDLDDFDIIISRGGTAKMISANITIPVVEIEISVYDILRAIKLAENYSNRFAIIGYPAITNCAKMLCNLLQYDIEIITLDENSEPHQQMEQLKNQGYEMVLCDMVGTSIARELGMNFILITSGKESVEAALDQAVRFSKIFSITRQQSQVLKAAVIQSRESLFIYTKDGQLYFSSMERSPATEEFFSQVEQNLSSFLADSRFRLENQVESFVYTMYSRHITINGIAYVYIYLLMQNAPVLVDDIGVSHYDTNSQTNSENSGYYGSANLIGDMRNTMEQFAGTLAPVMILGEIGTGKTKAAAFLYSHSEYRKSPYVIIDCANTNQKKWNYLIDNVNSPFNDINTTIFIQNLQALEPTLAQKFLSCMNQGDFCRRNRFIFSFTVDNNRNEKDPVCQSFMNYLSCLVLRIPPLRERIQDMPNIATLYISQANIEFGKQVVGLEPESMELMQQFNWSQNLSQFKRIIRQLIVSTDDYYIKTEDVRQALKQENPHHSYELKPGYEILNLNQSLDEINHDITRIVLEQEGMNKTKTSERLGISRSTLWRILQR